ncbi:hypothetical protein AVEN_101057-1 [Araneus ventricosus]|uniref:Uncharacterized protein n=1 Tax=Araneus ventricosus TaxID=182803 RepID=A0A4Y2FT36_ARAVE|nr:hypothetical protein AVEN_101057-1 [Araneus ventricosus]
MPYTVRVGYCRCGQMNKEMYHSEIVAVQYATLLKDIFKFLNRLTCHSLRLEYFVIFHQQTLRSEWRCSDSNITSLLSWHPCRLVEGDAC